MEDFRILDPDPYNYSTGSASLLGPIFFFQWFLLDPGQYPDLLFIQILIHGNDTDPADPDSYLSVELCRYTPI